MPKFKNLVSKKEILEEINKLNIQNSVLEKPKPSKIKTKQKAKK